MDVQTHNRVPGEAVDWKVKLWKYTIVTAIAEINHANTNALRNDSRSG